MTPDHNYAAAEQALAEAMYTQHGYRCPPGDTRTSKNTTMINGCISCQLINTRKRKREKEEEEEEERKREGEKGPQLRVSTRHVGELTRDYSE